MNLLIPSAGRKIYLVRKLAEALHARGGRLFAADLSDRASALSAADEVVELPPFGSKDYWSAADSVIRENKIKAVIPVRDAELAGWAERAEAGALSAKVFLSSAKTLWACRDKSTLYEIAAAVGIRCPRWELLVPGNEIVSNLNFPLIAKPRRGSGSQGVIQISSFSELSALLAQPTDDLLLQEFAEGQEYSVDCYAKADGSLAACCSRQRMLVRDGECVIGKPMDKPELLEACGILAGYFDFRGVINAQFIDDSGGPILIDLNPRFPGGIAITEGDGLKYTEWTVSELFSESLRGEP